MLIKDSIYSRTFILFICVFLANLATGRIIYVDDDAPGANDGSSWADAFNYLQDALAAASSGNEIRVAQGIYKPDQGVGITPGDREATLQLINGVTLKGGYAGFGEPDPDALDPNMHETILSGDLNSDDAGASAPCDLRDEPTRAENSYHVVTGSWTAVLEGFTITAGNANAPVNSYPSHNQGGGMINSEGSPTVVNCMFYRNSARLSGGGVSNNPSSSPQLVNCTFVQNASYSGGGMHIGYGETNPILTNCTFSQNWAREGGGMVTLNGTPILTNCTFTANIATYAGGGLYNEYYCRPTLTDCTFIENTSPRGGGMCNCYDGFAMLINCTFRANSSRTSGGGFYDGLYAFHYPGITEGNTIFTNCSFNGNSALRGGGIYIYFRTSSALINCAFSGNSARFSGGGMYLYASGGGLCTPELVNCTFSANSAHKYSGGIYNKEKSEGRCIPTLTNCIFWANSDSDGVDESAQIQGGSAVISNCCIQDWTDSLGGTHNNRLDPQLVDPDGADNVLGTEDDNLRLLPGSACLDCGDNAALSPTDLTDLDGNPRIVNGIVDIGAYEGPKQGFLLTPELVQIPEGGLATFAVALAMDPVRTIEVTVTVESGDPDITIESDAILIFDSSNYSQPQTVTFSAVPDTDYLHGSALIHVSASGLAPAGVTATEIDSEAPPILYVDNAAEGANDGITWQDAFIDLQDALCVARATPEVQEIRVAQGTYRPAEPSGDREAVFRLIDGVAIKGGYAGLGNPDPNSRDVDVYQTILSADLNGDDGPGFTRNEENSYHVVMGSNTDETAVLDGFTIVGGNPNGSWPDYYDGGGMYINSGKPTILNCTFTANEKGGMVNDWRGCPTLIGCVFSANGWYGMVNYTESEPVVMNCTFVGNEGNGMRNFNNCSTVANCKFYGNTGSGIENRISSDGRGSATIVNCVFSGNADEYGAGINNGDFDTTVVNCTLSGNQAERSGGGISNSGDLTVVNCILWDNTDSGGADESAQIRGGTLAVDYCCIQGLTGTLGGAGNRAVDPLFVDIDGADDVLGTLDDDLRLLGGSACIDAGYNLAVPSWVDTDVDDKPRFVDDLRMADTGRGTPPIIDIGAYEGPNQGLLLSAKSIEIAEAGVATFTVILAMDPLGPVEVIVSIESGDPDITIQSPQVLTFDSSNYRLPQTVTLAAAEDTDYLRGSAVISLSVAGLATARIQVKELDVEIQEVVHVDKWAHGANDGTTWKNAFTDLQEALRVAAATPTVKEVRVAKGIYTPAPPSGNREATFQLLSGVAIKGGYCGNAVDMEVYQTVLSGDLNGDDVQGVDPCDLLTEPSRADNSFNVVTGSETNPTAVLDCFIITGGNAGYSPGGGMFNDWGSPTVTNCVFIKNSSNSSGGGMGNISSDPTVINCIFKENASDWGGGMYSHYSSKPTLINCTFSGNVALGNESYGGGMLNYTADATLMNCVFVGNSADSTGGGVCNYLCSPTFINCTFSGNSAGWGGCGMCNCISEPTLTNCTFVGNHGNALDCICEDFENPSHIVLTNCIIWDGEDAIHDSDGYGSTYTITYSNIQGGWPGEGNIDIAPRFVDADGPDNVFGTEDDDHRLQAGSPCIDAGDNKADTNIIASGVQPLIGVDADRTVRRFDDSATADAGLGESPIVDMGAFEFGSPSIPSTLYVNDDAEGANTGTSWEDAFADLQLALQTAFVASGKVSQIWVAAGTYVPGLPSGGRSSTFRLINRLEIYGGFAGVESAVDQRDPVSNVTVLSGDLNGDDGPNFTNNEDNSYHVVTGSWTDSSAVLDGFFVTAGNADISGGADGQGAGLYISSGSPLIGNCTFINNSAEMGSGIYCDRSFPSLLGCKITGNTATIRGGGIYCHLSSLEMTDCTITENTSSNRGGGVYSYSSSLVLAGCTITSNSSDYGGGVYCDNGRSSFAECTFSSNWVEYNGGGLFAGGGDLVLTDCIFSDNHQDGANIFNAVVRIVGSVQIASNNLVGIETILDGDGILHIQSDVTLIMDNSRIHCNVSGPGTIQVDLDSELIIEADAVIDLGHETDQNGQIVCDGLLRLREYATIMDAQVSVTRASFENNAIIVNCVINAEAGAPYGQFFIEDNVYIWLDKIEADGDRYLDLEPREFDCNSIHINAIEVNITEGVGGSYGGLFELRGRYMEIPPCDSNECFCQVDSVPDFDPNTWTIDQLELIEGAKLNLTNRFDFQSPYDSGGDEEVLYVKRLILGPNSVLNTAFNRLYYESLIMDSTAKVVNVPLLGFSLNNIAFDDEIDFLTRVKHNKFEHSENPAYDRIHVERVEGLEPDPNGMMRMCNLLDIDPESSTYGQVVQARAKGLFAKSNEDKILIQFEYLFGTSEPGLELVIYLTDVPELLEHYDPNRQDHYIEVARLPVPPVDRPGSPGSGRFGVFHKYISRGDLDFVRGTRIELELLGPDGACVLINNWDPQVHCSELYCGDVTGDKGATIEDYLTVIASVGSPVEISPDGGGTACLEFGFSADGRVDTLDVSARAWMLDLEESERPLNLCDVPLTPGIATVSAATDFFESTNTTRLFSLEPPGIHLDALLVTGKRGADNVSDKLLEDNLYVFDANGQYIDKFKPEPNRSNGKLVQDSYGDIYQVNHEKGLLRLSNGDPVIPPAGFPIDIDPRYGLPAQVSIGLGHKEIYSDIYEEFIWTWVGRPILDAAFDADGYVYIVPVVVDPHEVDPNENKAYVAAAKLQLLDTADPPYRIVQLYDDPPPSGDNQYLNNLREIEIDRAGNLYVINTDKHNDADILWVYDTETGQVKRRVTLGNSDGDCYVPAPVTMHVSNTKDRLYLASSKNDPNANSDLLYVLSKQDLNIVRTIEINGMGHITDITEDPTTGTLWVVGFTMSEIPDYIDSDVEPFYEPYLAGIPYEGNGPVEAMPLSAPVLYPDNDLALPLSIIWTATEGKRVNFMDFAVFATHWLESSCTSPD